MKSDLNDLKKLTLELIQNGSQVQETNQNLIKKIYGSKENDMRSILRKNLVHR
jgi:hypothetical protein